MTCKSNSDSITEKATKLQGCLLIIAKKSAGDKKKAQLSETKEPKSLHVQTCKA